jgi:FixJ family two-component response regulator
MAPVVKTPDVKVRPTRPRVLVVDDEATLVETVQDIVGPALSCEILTAATLKQARKIITSQSIELLVTDVKLPDGDGLNLLKDLRSKQPAARAIVITGQPTVDTTLTAFRSGALDFLPKPFSSKQLIDGVKGALQRQLMVQRHEQRLTRLKNAVKKLSEARKLVSKKVDLLCNDLVSAYSELSKQFDGVRTQEGFRNYIHEAKDLEQLLCHTMDWLLRQLGYSNIALWLASNDDADYQLGAYMKYTIVGEPIVTDAVKREVLPQVLREGLVRFSPDEMAERFSDEELEHLGGQEFIAINCTYLGEPLASLVFFRDSAESFSEEDAATLQMISPIFAVELATMVRGHEEGERAEASSDDEDSNRSRKDDADDWWKRGERPPF